MAQKPMGMHPEDIKAALRKMFGSLAAFSVMIGRDSRAVSKTIATPGYSVPIEREIAKALKVAVKAIWPDRYHSDGTPVSFVVSRIPTALRGGAHRQNEVAA
ncbi:helix-turn-helix domain-containing protein [Acetobacter fabarum]|uniref:helix-turn-helix domain-containing protein n=1 Tax=Acetobacter fabarum TaxID=483199 RepID=UPI00312B3F36